MQSHFSYQRNKETISSYHNKIDDQRELLHCLEWKVVWIKILFFPNFNKSQALIVIITEKTCSECLVHGFYSLVLVVEISRHEKHDCVPLKATIKRLPDHGKRGKCRKITHLLVCLRKSLHQSKVRKFIGNSRPSKTYDF